MKADEILTQAAELFKLRNATYGDNYKFAGAALHALFPNGLQLSSEADQLRYHIFMLIIVKLSRYANNFAKGGHQDSIRDAAVYCAMLEQIDEEVNAHS